MMAPKESILPDNQALLNYLSTFVTDHKKEIFKQVIRQRTRYLTVVLEDIYQSQNTSAVLRTCDCLGIQDIHIIQNNYRFEVNPDVTQGANKWLTLIKYSTNDKYTLNAFQTLKKNGYQIVVTSPHRNGVNLEEFVITGKTALVFGTEQNGVTETACHFADAILKLPMVGFTESYNISVSAAIILYHLLQKIKNNSANWQLTEIERTEILLD